MDDAKSIQTALDECHDKTGQLEAEVAEKQKQIDDLTAKGAEALETVKQLNADKDTLQAKIDELEANIARLAELVKNQAKGKTLFMRFYLSDFVYENLFVTKRIIFFRVSIF
mgnify:CR=1 FL=1